MDNRACFICGTPGTGQGASPRSGPLMDCPRCGKFWFDSEAWDAAEIYFMRTPPEEAERTRLVASHVIRRSRPKDPGAHIPAINKATFEEILRRPLPTPEEQVAYLLLWVGDHLSLPEDKTWLPQWELCAVMGTGRGGSGFEYIISEVTRRGLLLDELKENDARVFEHFVGLSFTGWSEYQKLKTEVRESRFSFMAMKFGYEPSFEMYSKHFVPAATQAGFTLRRVDSVARHGLIDVHMMVDLRTAAFVVADLTENSYGAYWEAGFATGLGKPVIYTCEEEAFKTAGTHFDTNHHVTILWKLSDPGPAADTLKSTIRNALPDLAKLTDDP